MTRSINAEAALRDIDGLAVVGRTRHDLMGIRYEEGEGGNTATTTTTAPEGTQTTTAPVPTPPAATTTTTEPPAATEGEDLWTDPAKAKAEIDRLRRENGDERINAKAAAADEARKELLKSLTKALDPNAAESDAPTVEGLTDALTVERQDAREAKFELSVLKFALANKLDGEKLTNSRSFFNATKDLDPKADDFTTKLTAAIEAEVKRDQTIKLPGGAAVSGAEQHSGTGDNQQTTITKDEFDKMSVEELTNLYRSNKPEYDRLSNL